MMPTFVKFANSELVCGAWLARVPNLSAGSVGTTLPRDPTTWNATGFVQYSVAGGTPNPDTGLRAPVLSCYCWARTPNSNKPLWGMANDLAESIYAATRSEVLSHGLLALPVVGYPDASLKEVVCVQEPRRTYGDIGDAARYRVDVQIYWSEA